MMNIVEEFQVKIASAIFATPEKSSVLCPASGAHSHHAPVEVVKGRSAPVFDLNKFPIKDLPCFGEGF